jgi:flagellar hook-basal body complex protein FliE
MSVTPITSISALSSISGQNTAARAGDNSFTNMMDDIMNAVNETEKTSANDIYNIASGSVDNLHSVLINSEKAELAILTAVEIRNKLLDSYNEIMRISL